ncbi:MAG: hypothetical protein EOO75_17865 [Myxococcales bacterium]|nr:MAG: hypothetical protein EOO75_17865 [Myxococcales bacterium]
MEGTEERLLAFDHRAPDNLWLSAKVGLWQNVNEARHRAWAVGAQLGPRVAIAPGAHGAGFQGLMLVGQTVSGVHIVGNLGGIVDPGAEVSRGRPVAVLSGVDISSSLGGSDRWSFSLDLSGVFFVSPEKNQLVTTFGPTWAATPWLDVGVSGLFSVLEGGDRYGGYVSLAPKLTLWGDASPADVGRP